MNDFCFEDNTGPPAPVPQFSTFFRIFKKIFSEIFEKREIVGKCPDEEPRPTCLLPISRNKKHIYFFLIFAKKILKFGNFRQHWIEREMLVRMIPNTLRKRILSSGIEFSVSNFRDFF